jgi:drug/metabolite transporter (DMT)-like permease
MLLMLIATFCWATNIIAGKEALRGFGALVLAQMRVLGTSAIYLVLFLAWPRSDYPETPSPRSAARAARDSEGRDSRAFKWRSAPRADYPETPSGRGSRAFKSKSAPRWPSLPQSLRDWAFLGLVALFGVTLNQLFFIGGLARTSAAHSALIVALGPVMVLALSRLLRMEALTVLKSAGILVAFCGVAILTTGKGKGAGVSGAHWQGDVLAFAASGVFAYFTILVKKAAVQFDALTLNTIVFALGSVLMLPLSAPELRAVRWSAVPALAWWSLAYMVILGSVLAYLLFAFALTELTPSRVAAFNYLQPLIAISLGVWMLGEKISSNLIAGGALILVGLYFTERENSEY